MISTFKPVHPLRHSDLEPGAFAWSTVLCDGNAGNREDLAGEEQPEPGVPAEAPGE